jgi:hypothetical protein
VVGGLSILGTTGRVRPFSCPALQESLRCGLQVALALGLKDLAFVPGHIGGKAVHRHFVLRPEQVIEVSNEWGYMLGQAAREKVHRLLVLGTQENWPAGKQWDTIPADRKRPALVEKIAAGLFPAPAEGNTVEVFWPPGRATRKTGRCLAQRIRQAVEAFTGYKSLSPWFCSTQETDWAAGVDPMEGESHPIVIVGCGPGPDYLTAATIRAIRRRKCWWGPVGCWSCFHHRATVAHGAQTRAAMPSGGQDRRAGYRRPRLASLAQPILKRSAGAAAWYSPVSSSRRPLPFGTGLAGCRVIDAHGKDPRFI